LFRNTFPTPSGKARFHAVRHAPLAEEPDAEYPYFLTTGRTLAHYQSGTQTRRVEKLLEMTPDAYAELHPHIARRHGLSEGGGVTLTTRRGSARFRVKLNPGIREDTIFAPFHQMKSELKFFYEDRHYQHDTNHRASRRQPRFRRADSIGRRT
jgi:assimilatory nitrate reductase catalytic subunit